jgi:D-alanyl-D-alanine carboxypeptidase
MMTMYLLFDALKQGKIRLTDTITFSDYAASRPSTNLSVDQGDTIGVETAILAMVVRSANDVATAVAERLGGGDEQAFATKMTARARQLGMTNTGFHNASGLPDDGNRTTARDMAKLGMALMRDFPQYYPYFSRYSFTYHGVNYTGHNRLVKTFKGADGIKTGYVRASGFNVVTSAEQNGRRLVGAVLGGTSPSVRDRQMTTLLKTAFLEQPGTPNTLIAKAPGKSPDKSMTTAVADVLAEPANAAEGDDLADDDTDAAPKAGTLPAGSKTLVSADATAIKSTGEGDIA